MTISDSTIDRNQAIGGANEVGGDGADGRGGGLATHFGGVLIVSASTVDDNLAVGGEGGLGGNGLGGGLYNDTGSMTSLTGDKVGYNIAVGAFGFGGLGQGVGGGTYDLGANTVDPHDGREQEPRVHQPPQYVSLRSPVPASPAPATRRGRRLPSARPTRHSSWDSPGLTRRQRETDLGWASNP